MNRILITLCVLCISLGVKAHQPDLSSTMLVDQGGNKWVLQVRAALTAFEYEVEQHFGEDAYASPEEFRELVIKHVQAHISILYNDNNAAVLQNGIVKLGHETNVVFEVLGTPEDIQSLTVKNSSFNDISRNKSALIVLKEGFAKDQFVLNNSNEHTIELVVNDSKFVLVSNAQTKSSYFLLVFAGVLLALSIIYFIFKNRKSEQLTQVQLSS